MKKQAVSLSVVLCALSFAQTQEPPAGVLLNADEAKVFVTGKKLTFIRSSDNNKVRWDLREDGFLYGNNFTSNSRDAGKWKINELGEVCAEWRGKSVNTCYGIRKKGDKTELVAPTFLSEITSVD